MQEVRFELSKPLEYAVNGEATESQFITLTAPTSRNRRECAELKQAFSRALHEVTSAAAPVSGGEPKDEEIEAEDVILMVSMSKSADLDKFLETCRKLLSSGVAKVGGEEKLTTPLLDKLDLDDFERLAGTYLVGFTLRSLLEKLKTT